MTGYAGERRNYRVGLVTDDFRMYHRVVPFLETEGFKVVPLRPGENVPPSVQVLVNGPAGDPRRVPATDDLEALLLSILVRLDPRPGDTYDRLVVGVDPGQRIGLALLADGEVLTVAIETTPQDCVARIARWLSCVPGSMHAVHVGTGAAPVGREIRRALRTALPGTPIASVSEESTTPWRHVTGSRHTDAAAIIAMRRPA